ncbi:MAG: hypothetical protein QM758_08555 [Armatimonas sp.]
MSQQAQIWGQVSEMAKRAALSPNWFRAIEAAHAIAWEDNVLVVGLRAEDGQHAGVLNTNDFRLKIEAAIRQVTGASKANFRVIEGITAQDWAMAKERDAIAVRRATEAIQKTRAAATSESAQSWEGLYDVIQQQWAQAEYRNFASGRGRFLIKAFDIIEEAIGTLGAPTDEAGSESFHEPWSV